MTPTQTFTVAAIGGLASLLALLATVGLALTVRALLHRATDAYENHRHRRHLLTTYRHQLDTLPTTHHPKKRP